MKFKVKQFIPTVGEKVVEGFELEIIPTFSNPPLTRDWRDTGYSLYQSHESGAVLTREVRRLEFPGGTAIPVTEYMIAYHSGRRTMAQRAGR